MQLFDATVADEVNPSSTRRRRLRIAASHDSCTTGVVLQCEGMGFISTDLKKGSHNLLVIKARTGK